MIPWRERPLTSSVAEVFNGLRGEAREKAMATGNYDELAKRPREPQREPVPQDDEQLDDQVLEAAAEAERSIAEGEHA